VLGKGAEGWHLGTCVSPDCPNKGVEQMVGLCEICLHCQLQSEYADYQNAFAQEDGTQPDISRQMLDSYSTLDAVARDAKKITLSAGLFPYYLLKENIMNSAAGLSSSGRR